MPAEERRTVPTVAEALTEWEQQRDLFTAAPVAVYVSTPITTGQRLLDWLRGEGSGLVRNSAEYLTALRSDVVLPNVQQAAHFVEILRWRHVGLVIDPTALDVPGWDQERYLEFWKEVLARHVRRVIFLNGWEHSNGCVLEFEAAQGLGLDCVTQEFAPLTSGGGRQLIASALEAAEALGIDVGPRRLAYERLSEVAPRVSDSSTRLLFKDEILNHLASTANVAQFVSFAPGRHLRQRYSRVIGFTPNYDFGQAAHAVSALLESSPEGAVNIRSFRPERPEGNPFKRNLRSVDAVLEQLRALAGDEQLHTIVNETVDESDGGVSGVAYRGAIEFSPDATPRCVDDVAVRTATFPFELGMALLRLVYGFEPDLRGREGSRVEFSIHPRPRGWRHDHTIIWQAEQRPADDLTIEPQWPNRFSQLLGDKAFGLALAAAAGLRVPKTIVFSTRLFPFVFGHSVGTGAIWTRTCPAEKTPGYYPSVRGWANPYQVLRDPASISPTWHSAHRSQVSTLASVLVQEAVHALYSGKSVARSDSEVLIAGVKGEGDQFMVGDSGSEPLPMVVQTAVTELHTKARHIFSKAEIEWVFDGTSAWIVQIGASPSRADVVDLPPETEWEEFRFEKGGLEDFRRKVEELQSSHRGLLVFGNVSPLSHVGEIAQAHGVPVRFVQH